MKKDRPKISTANVNSMFDAILQSMPTEMPENTEVILTGTKKQNKRTIKAYRKSIKPNKTKKK